MHGKFVVFEGIDGCGKQTQIEMLSRLMRKARARHAVFKYPTQNAKKIHGYLQGKMQLGSGEIFAEYANDLKAGQEELGKALGVGWAIADRYVISTAAYQGINGKLEGRKKQLGEIAWIRPDAVIWLDLDVEEAMRRKGAQKTPDMHEKDEKFLQEVRQNYESLYSTRWLCKNWAKIDASQTPEEVFEDVRKALSL